MCNSLRKCSLGFLCLILVLSMLCGCGNDASVNDDSKESVSSTTAILPSEEPTSASIFTKRFVNDFSDGYAWITLSDASLGNKRFACINTNGEIQFYLNDLIEIEYNNGIGEFKDGYAVVVDKSDISYIIDTSGKILSSSKDTGYDKVICYDDGYFLVEKCNNDLHEVNYTYSVIDKNGKIMNKDCFIYDKKYETFEYCGDGVFCCTINMNGDRDCYNVKTYTSFKLEDVNSFYGFNNSLSGFNQKYMWGVSQLVNSDGNVIDSDIGDYYFVSSILDNYALCQDSGDNIYVYDTKSREMNEIYHCGNGISAIVVDYNNDHILLDVKDDQSKHWVVLIDFYGNNIFTPFEGEPEQLSCDRIIAHFTETGYKRFVFDIKGKQIEFDNETIDIKPTKYYNDLICVSIIDNKGNTISDNYMDINGKLLFSDN